MLGKPCMCFLSLRLFLKLTSFETNDRYICDDGTYTYVSFHYNACIPIINIYVSLHVLVPLKID